MILVYDGYVPQVLTLLLLYSVKCIGRKEFTLKHILNFIEIMNSFLASNISDKEEFRSLPVVGLRLWTTPLSP